MNTSQFISTLELNGVRLYLDGDKLKYQSKQAGVMTETVMATLKEYKPEIIEYLKMLSILDFCGKCKTRLIEQPNGEWDCPTPGCFESRVGGVYEN